MPQTPIQNNDPLLINLQANILKGYGRNFAHHLFFQLDINNIGFAKAWIRNFANNEITNAKKQLDDAIAFKAGADGGTLFTLSLSSSGYVKLGLSQNASQTASFKAGMKNRATFLGDDINIWDAELNSEIDMLIIVANDDSSTALQEANRLITEILPFASLLFNQRGNVLKMIGGLGIEHFGYADGISQPLYLEDDINTQPSTSEWNDETAINLVLVNDSGTNVPDSFGSYLVFRKLEQNVNAFKVAEALLPKLNDIDGNINDELAGAMLVGRFENSLPTIKSSNGRQSNPPLITNDFDYKDANSISKCPFHSHIRLMNPRNGDVIAGDVSAQRITRRGIPYDDIKRIPEDRITQISEDMLESNKPTSRVGLLFMCYQSSIDIHFEILQGHWANEGQIKNHSIGAQDSIIGQGTNPLKPCLCNGGNNCKLAPLALADLLLLKGEILLYA
ncbi:MAG: Dyp-type peroxidase family [Sphingobacteriales bacterium]|nr:Dyp-type peroxidase family [Sphingobacteriales bacterium]